MDNSVRVNGSSQLLLRNDRSTAAQRLIEQLEKAGWSVRDYPISQSTPYARSEDGRAAEGFANIRKEFIGYE